MRAGAVGLHGRTLFSTFVTLSYGQIFKFQILSPLLPLNLWLNFENLTHCPFNIIPAGEAKLSGHAVNSVRQYQLLSLSKTDGQTLWLIERLYSTKIMSHRKVVRKSLIS